MNVGITGFVGRTGINIVEITLGLVLKATGAMAVFYDIQDQCGARKDYRVLNVQKLLRWDQQNGNVANVLVARKRVKWQ